MTADSGKRTEKRTNADFSLPCPDCGVECRPENVTKLKRRKVKDASGVTVVLPQQYLDLTCDNCHFELWIALDSSGKPITE